MSKRKIEAVYAESNGGGGGGRRGIGDAKAPAATATAGGWAGLPPELVRRVGQLQSDARSLAGMERTCKTWRVIIIQGDSTVQMGSKPLCLWRDLALTKFPRLSPLIELVGTTSSAAKPDTKHSWKALYRTNAEARRLFDSRTSTFLVRPQPKSSWKDYFVAVEFHRGNELLFVASGTGGEGKRTSPLWNQDIKYDDYGTIICTDSLDSELVSRLGENPFDKENLDGIRARVVVTRLSDLSVAELGSATHYFSDEEGLTDDDGDLPWNDILGGNTFLPVGFSNIRGDGKRAHVISDTLRMQFWLKPDNGTVLLVFESRDSFGEYSEWRPMDSYEELRYLEMQCPWT